MLGIRWLLRGGVLLLLAACGGGTATEAVNPDRLKILALQAPENAALLQRLAVRVLVADRVGVAAVELRLGDQWQEVRANGGRFATLTADLTPTRAGVLRIEAVARGVDGVRGATASAVLVVGDRRPASVPMSAASLGRRIADWNSKGLREDEAYARGPLYEVDDAGPVSSVEDWWLNWQAQDGPQPFEWAVHCSGAPGITPNGEVLRCWLDLNPLVAVSINWEKIVGDYIQDMPYPFWPEEWKHELDVAFYGAYTWLASGLQAPYLIPQDPLTNQIPSSAWTSAIALHETQARPLWMATVAHSLALEIGGFVPWSILSYDVDDLWTLFNSHSMFFAGEWDVNELVYEGYWCFDVLHAHPKTSFQFFVDQDVIRSTHLATITRLLEWSGSHMVHCTNLGGDTDGKTPMQVAYMHWQYYGDAPVQRMLSGTIRENHTEVRHWTHGCTGTCPFYASILRALNIPAEWQQGWGIGDEPHLNGHTAPIFPTIGKALSHGDDVLGWGSFVAQVSPPPATLSASRLFITWDTFVDWFYTHPDDNAGRQKYFEIPLDVLSDEILDLHCSDLPQGLPHAQSSVYERFAEHYDVAGLEAKGLWTRLDAKVAALDYCD